MNTARFLKYDWPFSNIIHERVKAEILFELFTFDEKWVGADILFSCLYFSVDFTNCQKFLKTIPGMKKSLRLKYLKPNWPTLCTETYVKPNQISTMQTFMENKRLKVGNCFCKKAPSQMFDWVLKMRMLLARS